MFEYTYTYKLLHTQIGIWIFRINEVEHRMFISCEVFFCDMFKLLHIFLLIISLISKGYLYNLDMGVLLIIYFATIWIVLSL
jgi:hypothetical protein